MTHKLVVMYAESLLNEYTGGKWTPEKVYAALEAETTWVPVVEAVVEDHVAFCPLPEYDYRVIRECVRALAGEVEGVMRFYAAPEYRKGKTVYRTEKTAGDPENACTAYDYIVRAVKGFGYQVMLRAWISNRIVAESSIIGYYDEYPAIEVAKSEYQRMVDWLAGY